MSIKRKKPMIKTSIMIMSALLSVTICTAQQNLDYVFYREVGDYRSLYVYEVGKDSSRKFYQTPDDYSFMDFKVSPTGNYVGLVEFNGEHMRPEDLGYALQNLVILDVHGKVLAKVKQVLDFAWSPSSDSIAFIRGRDYGGMELKPEGVWLLELKNRFRETMMMPDSAAEISWAIHNGKVYVRWRYIHEIDLRSKTIRRTDFNGMYFSPDGRFYYKPNYEGVGFALFETRSNRNITPRMIEREKVNFEKWLSNTELVVGDIDREKIVFDMTTKRIKRTFSGQLLGFDEKRKEILVRRDRHAFKELGESRFERITIR